jgi:hypothetical protein
VSARIALRRACARDWVPAVSAQRMRLAAAGRCTSADQPEPLRY